MKNQSAKRVNIVNLLLMEGIEHALQESMCTKFKRWL